MPAIDGSYLAIGNIVIINKHVGLKRKALYCMRM